MALSELQAKLKELEVEDRALVPVPTHAIAEQYTSESHERHILAQPLTYEAKSAQLTVLEEELAFYQHRNNEALEQTEQEQSLTQQRFRDVLNAESSDDSDGFDPDHDAEWRDQTRRIFSVCRDVEVHRGDAQCDAFCDLLADLKRGADLPLTLSEVQMVWDALRFTYRNADPVHNKHWLSHSHELVDKGHLQSRVSITNYWHVMRAAADFEPLSQRHRAKVQKWLARSMLLVHRRVVRLADYGIEEPTWYQVNVSGMDRQEYVPLPYIWKLVDLNTANRKISSTEYTHVNAQFKPALPEADDV